MGIKFKEIQKPLKNEQKVILCMTAGIDVILCKTAGDRGRQRETAGRSKITSIP